MMRRGAEELDERFTAFVRSRGEHHLRMATLLTGNRDAAEDLVQASLLKLYRVWPAIDTVDEPDAYLRRIIVNTRRSWWRARWRQETPVPEVPEAAGEDSADRHVAGAVVRQALARLPGQQRAVLVLRYCEDLPEAEVASLLGCSAGTAVAVLLSMTVATAPPALAAVTSALSRAAIESFRMNLTDTTVPAQPTIPSPLSLTGELDLKRNLGQETLSNGWRTLIVGGDAYTELPPSQARAYGTGGKLWTEEPAWVTNDELPYRSAGGQLAWDFNSSRPFNPQAVLALLQSDAKALDDEGGASGPGWTGTRYRFTVPHPDGTGGLIDSITCTLDVDSQGHIRSLAQTTVFVASGKPGTAGQMSYRADFTFSDFGIRFSVTPPPASQVSHDIGVGVQF